jgi:hypothetical protein
VPRKSVAAGGEIAQLFHQRVVNRGVRRVVVVGMVMPREHEEKTRSGWNCLRDSCHFQIQMDLEGQGYLNPPSEKWKYRKK